MSGKFRSAGDLLATDARVVRTRAALFRAFNGLFLSARGTQVSVPQIIDRAGIGRSTFYDHFSGADELMLDALRRPLKMLAEAAVSRNDVDQLTGLLQHFWENRRRARLLLDGTIGRRVETLLAEIVEPMVHAQHSSKRLGARMMASSLLGPIRAWLTGEAPSTARDLATLLAQACEALVSINPDQNKTKGVVQA